MKLLPTTYALVLLALVVINTMTAVSIAMAMPVAATMAVTQTVDDEPVSTLPVETQTILSMAVSSDNPVSALPVEAQPSISVLPGETPSVNPISIRPSFVTVIVNATTARPAEPTLATRGEPTPDEPTPDEPAPDEPAPDEPTPDEPTPDEPTPDEPTPDELPSDDDDDEEEEADPTGHSRPKDKKKKKKEKWWHHFDNDTAWDPENKKGHHEPTFDNSGPPFCFRPYAYNQTLCPNGEMPEFSWKCFGLNIPYWNRKLNDRSWRWYKCPGLVEGW